MGFSLFVLSSIVVVLSIRAAGYPVVLEDSRDIFESAGRIAEYADERLRAAARGESLPSPPVLRADVGALRIALGFTVLFQVLNIVAVVWITRRSPGELLRLLRLDRYDTSRIWRPAVATIAAYLGVIGYAVLVNVLGFDALVPESTVPSAVTRDALTLVFAGIAAVIMAPVSEELLYRGLIMGGLLKWGFLPAAVVSSALFSAVHLDVGSLIPFFGVGMLLAWLYWSGGSLWDAILFHFLFNLLSYMVLVGMGG